MIPTQNKSKEITWWQTTQASLARRSMSSIILHNKIIFSLDRASFNLDLAKQQMSETIQHHLGNEKVERLLIAPCGSGNDLKYLEQFADKTYGIDLSPEAIGRCPDTIEAKVGDILSSGYLDESFDMIVSPLFFHHLLKVGFDPFLKEFYRILKPQGMLVTLEPSLWYPLNIVSRPIKHIFRNPYGEVEDEAPFSPMLLTKAMRQVGFRHIELHGATHCHSSIYVPVSRILHRLTKSLLDVSPLKYTAWMFICWAEK